MARAHRRPIAPQPAAGAPRDHVLHQLLAEHGSAPRRIAVPGACSSRASPRARCGSIEDHRAGRGLPAHHPGRHSWLPILSAAAVAGGQQPRGGLRVPRVARGHRSLEDMNREFVVPVIVDSDYVPERYTTESARVWADDKKLDFGHAPDGVPDGRLEDQAEETGARDSTREHAVVTVSRTIRQAGCREPVAGPGPVRRGVERFLLRAPRGGRRAPAARPPGAPDGRVRQVRAGEDVAAAGRAVSAAAGRPLPARPLAPGLLRGAVKGPPLEQVMRRLQEELERAKAEHSEPEQRRKLVGIPAPQGPGSVERRQLSAHAGAGVRSVRGAVFAQRRQCRADHAGLRRVGGPDREPHSGRHRAAQPPGPGGRGWTSRPSAIASSCRSARTSCPRCERGSRRCRRSCATTCGSIRCPVHAPSKPSKAPAGPFSARALRRSLSTLSEDSTRPPTPTRPAWSSSPCC